MKISFNMDLNSASHGGGIGFANFLKSYLENTGIDVVNHLRDDDIDIIFHINITYCAAYSFYAAYLYKLEHPTTVIAHRVNDSGMHRPHGLMARLMAACGRHSDYLIYISEWLKEVMHHKLYSERPYTVIHNGADEDVFNQNQRKRWEKKSRLKIVTHHWSSNFLKGHEIYQYLDELLGQESIRNKYEFIYIGNYPQNIVYKNTTLVPPLTGKALADELKKHHVYITAARKEAAPMHPIEGALCGLPILYVDSGALPEYCRGFGIRFCKENLVEKMEQMYEHYDSYYDRMHNYAYTAGKMAGKYLNLFETLISQRRNYIESATIARNRLSLKTYLLLCDKIYFPFLNRGGLIHKFL